MPPLLARLLRLSGAAEKSEVALCMVFSLLGVILDWLLKFYIITTTQDTVH